MNSSTKAPPQQAQKFRFDTDFDVEDERLRVEAMREAAVTEAESVFEPETYVPPAPVFSEEEVQYAREEAFKAGHQQGLDEAKQSIDNALATLTAQLIVQCEKLSETEQHRAQQAQQLALQTTIATIKKMWPAVIKQLGLEIVTDTIRQSMDYNPEETRIVVRVHDSMLDAVIKQLPDITEQKAFAGKVIVLSDQGVAQGDCKVEWADGGMERLSRDLSAQIDRAMDRILTLITQTSTNADAERMSQ